MQVAAGLFLFSTAALNDTYFAGTTIYLAQYNADGAVGFVLDRPFGRSLRDLEEFRHSPAFPLFEGGPVDQEHLFFVHRRPDRITGGVAVADGIFYGGLFSNAVTGLNNRSLAAGDLKIFVGYCGWDSGDLEAEIAEGSWELKPGKPDLIFGGLSNNP